MNLLEMYKNDYKTRIHDNWVSCENYTTMIQNAKIQLKKKAKKCSSGQIILKDLEEPPDIVSRFLKILWDWRALDRFRMLFYGKIGRSSGLAASFQSSQLRVL